MAETIDLDFLLQRAGGERAEPKTVTLLGKQYALCDADVLEGFLRLVGTVERWMAQTAQMPDVEPESPEEKVALVRQMGSRYAELRDELHGMIRTLVPAFPEELLLRHFGAVGQAQALLQVLLDAVIGNAGEGLKKNAGGGNTGKPRVTIETEPPSGSTTG